VIHNSPRQDIADRKKANDVGPTGKCPESHPVVIPQVMYEVRWDVSLNPSFAIILQESLRYLTGCARQTRQFNDKNLWPEDGSQPFVFSTGDP
jgi:hypothetical protein